MDILKLNSYNDLPKNYTGIVEYKNLTIYCKNPTIYYLNGLQHREDGPAIIYSGGKLEYYINDNDITKQVNDCLSGKTNIPPYKKWDNNRLLFKLTFG